MIDLVLVVLVGFHFNFTRLEGENGHGYGVEVSRKYGEQTRSINLNFYNLKHIEFYYQIEQPYYEGNTETGYGN